MQKNSLAKLAQEEITRAIIFASTLFIILAAGFGSVAYAANGGLFGDILNKILASGNWENPGDGTVKNAQMLSGMTADKFQQVKPNQSCEPGKCIYEFDTSGNVKCR